MTKGRRAIFLDYGAGVEAGQSALRRDKPERWRCDQGAKSRFLFLGEAFSLPTHHPIWSQDRHDYVAAMDLRLGERLENLSGDTDWVQQKPLFTNPFHLDFQVAKCYH